MGLLLEVKNLKKIYTTRLGGNKVQALENVSFSVEKGKQTVENCRFWHYGGIWIREDNTFKYFGVFG